MPLIGSMPPSWCVTMIDCDDDSRSVPRISLRKYDLMIRDRIRCDRRRTRCSICGTRCPYAWDAPQGCALFLVMVELESWAFPNRSLSPTIARQSTIATAGGPFRNLIACIFAFSVVVTLHRLRTGKKFAASEKVGVARRFFSECNEYARRLSWSCILVFRSVNLGSQVVFVFEHLFSTRRRAHIAVQGPLVWRPRAYRTAK